MKILVLPLLLLLLLWSCSNTTENSQRKKSSAIVDTPSSVKTNQTTADKKEEEFDSFFRRFSKDASFQLTRIEFPIKVLSNDGEEENIKLIEMQDWRYTDYSNLKSGLLRSEKVNEKSINLIYTVEGTGILVYHYFQKKSEKWMLVSIEDHST